MDGSWRPFLSRPKRGPGGGQGRDDAAAAMAAARAGRRALRLPGSELWVPFTALPRAVPGQDSVEAAATSSAEGESLASPLHPNPGRILREWFCNDHLFFVNSETGKVGSRGIMMMHRIMITHRMPSLLGSLPRSVC